MKSFFSKKIFFLSATRTPFGSFCGSLKNISAIDLGVATSKTAIAAAEIIPNQIDQIIFGNAMQTSIDAIYFARHIGLKCNIPQEVPALTVNRLCGSGFQAIINGAEQIELGVSDCVLVGGAESMSQAPHVIRNARWGIPLAQSKLEDSLWDGLTDSYIKLPMGITAENLTTLYNISQDEVDNYSIRSQELYKKAHKFNKFNKEIKPIQINLNPQKKIYLTKDEHPRPNSNINLLKQLPKVFKKDGLIHAGAASGICDGASALIMASEKFINKNKLNTIGEFINFGITGCDPKLMGLGPINAINQSLDRASIKLNNIDLIEVNEAFAPQVLAIQKELNIPFEKLNIHGGAIAIGHPFAATGARIITHLLHSLKSERLYSALGSACIGGGQGISIIIKNNK